MMSGRLLWHIILIFFLIVGSCFKSMADCMKPLVHKIINPFLTSFLNNKQQPNAISCLLVGNCLSLLLQTSMLF